MKHRIAVGASLAMALLVGCVFAAGDLRSGPQPGDRPTPFNPLHCNGPDEGTKQCLVWKNGINPVAMIFAREITGPLTSLVKKIDAATGEHNDARMGSFVVFLNDDENMEQKLKDLAKKEKLQHTVLSLMPNPAGPTGYNVNKEADVTVVLYTRQNVKVNHAYKKGELKEADVGKILDELPKILPAKK